MEKINIKPLNKYIFELLVIFIGITLSFMFEDWRENRSNRKREIEYYKNLLIDIESDRTYLNQIVFYSNRVINDVPKAINWIDSGVVEVDSSILATIIIPSIPRWKHTFLISMESVKSSGDLRLISNDEIIRKYHGVLSSNQTFNMTLERENESYKTYKNFFQMNYPNITKDFFVLSSYQPLNNVQINHLINDAHLYNNLSGVLYWNEFLIRQCEWLNNEINKLEELLKLELEKG